MKRKYYFWLKAVVTALSIALGAGLVHYAYKSSSASSAVVIYDDVRDGAAVRSIFKHDWYWLSNREYNPANINFVLTTNSPNEYESRYFGKMTIKVLREKNKLVGFITYYMLNVYEGKILFLAIDKEFRGKRYGEQLLCQAVNDLFAQGATVVRLVTRIDNLSAQKLYKRFGFKETQRELEDGFVHFAIWPGDQKKC